MKFNRDREYVMQRAAGIRLLLVDVDGVLTDGRLYYSAQGEELKVFNTLDGHGLKMLRQANIRCGIISGRKSAALALRGKDLGLDFVTLGREDKLAALQEILGKAGCGVDELAYAGDDLPDLPVLHRAGLGIAVPNAHPEIRRAAMLETEMTGGKGAVREICDFLLQAQDKYRDMLSHFQ